MGATVWVLLMLVFLPATGETVMSEIGIFRFEEICRVVQDAMVNHLIAHGNVPLGASCVEQQGS